MNPWEELEAGIFRFRDSCNVYAVRGRDDAWLLINSGTGIVSEKLDGLGRVRALTVLLTHHFRDHSAGAEKLRRGAGARIAGPWHEREHLSGEQRAMRAKQAVCLYDLTWDQFAPIEPLAVDRWMLDYDVPTIAGLQVEVIPTPGPTMGACSYVVTLQSGRRIAFVGELMSGAGKLPRLSPLQYNYNDLLGVENVLLSWDRLLGAKPDVALPSLGAPVKDCAAAVARLRENAARFEAIQPGIAARLAKRPAAGVEEVLPRLFRAEGAMAETHFLVSRTGKILALDYGYDSAAVRFPGRQDSFTRRPLLHSIRALQERTGVGRIDTVIATHYHDDHVAGIPLLQRIFGTELWAGANFADLLERPQDFDRPCLWPEPMRVARRLPLGETFLWEDVAITLHPMTGHTEFSTLVLLEFDGHRVAHTGDQFFYLDPKANRLTGPEGGGGGFTNHVYRNGLALGGYDGFVRRLRAFQPELILSGHYIPYRTSDEAWRIMAATAKAFDDAHRAILPLGEEEAHFGAEGQAAKLQPYQLRLPAGPACAALRGWVLNPFNRTASAEIRFVLPPVGWSVPPLTLALEAREKRVFETTLTVPAGAHCARQPIALELTVDGQPFGQVAEMWVTIE